MSVSRFFSAAQSNQVYLLTNSKSTTPTAALRQRCVEGLLVPSSESSRPQRIGESASHLLMNKNSIDQGFSNQKAEAAVGMVGVFVPDLVWEVLKNEVSKSGTWTLQIHWNCCLG